MAQVRKSKAAYRRSGTVAIEYGLVLPLLLMFTLGVMDAGRLFWAFITLNRATEAAARCGAVNTTLCPAASIPTYAVQQAWGLNGVTAAAFTVTNPACGVQVHATYTFKFVIPWFPWYGPTTPFGSANSMTLNATACYPPQS